MALIFLVAKASLKSCDQIESIIIIRITSSGQKVQIKKKKCRRFF